MATQFSLLRHPYYLACIQDWEKWRLTYKAGSDFVGQYLKKFTSREDDNDFELRKSITHVPAFAKLAVQEIMRAIFQRMADIRRIGGDEDYQDSVQGLNGGIDNAGSSMNNFMGTCILPELLTISRVGIYVDMPEIPNNDLYSSIGKRPYLYHYAAEDIRSWNTYNRGNSLEFNQLLLRETVYDYDPETGLPIGEHTHFRRLWLENNYVHVQFYTTENKPEGPEIILNIPKIPFVLVEISDSILRDVCEYQIGLMNIASSDMNYILQSNFPFYTEQFDARLLNPYLPKTDLDNPGETPERKTEEIKVGVSKGRRYPMQTERPGYIHPSPEPLMASMAKQDQLKNDIRQLVMLNASMLNPKMASAESKDFDNQGLEAGLAYVGLELEKAERQIAEIWATYKKSTPATIRYPEKYSLKTEEQRREEASDLSKLVPIVPSVKYRQAVHQKIAHILVGNIMTVDELQAMDREILSADGITADCEQIAKDIEIGILDLELGSKLRGYPEGTVKKAEKNHADRLARIAESQAAANNDPAARGVKDQSDNPNAGGRAEKKASRDTSNDGSVSDKTRGGSMKGDSNASRAKE